VPEGKTRAFRGERERAPYIIGDKELSPIDDDEPEEWIEEPLKWIDRSLREPEEVNLAEASHTERSQGLIPLRGEMHTEGRRQGETILADTRRRQANRPREQTRRARPSPQGTECSPEEEDAT
jgi:hypothetical protein